MDKNFKNMGEKMGEKEKTTRITVRIEEEKLEELQKIYEKKYPMQKNTTTNLIKNAIDFFLSNNKNIKEDEELKNINDEISEIKNLNQSEKMNSFDCRIFKNIQKNFTLKFEEEEILFLVKKIYEDEISKTNYINQKNSDQIFLFKLRDEEEFFLKIKNFIFKNLKIRHQLKPYLYEILYRKIYNEFPRDKEDIELFYRKFARDIILLNSKLKIALRKSIFESDEELKNFQKEIHPKLNQIKKYIDYLLSVMEKCNAKI